MRARTRPPERSRRGRARLAAAAALLLLIVVGFAIGVVAGVVWEEPGLFLAYLSGETEEVAWSARAAPGPAASVAAPPPGGDRPGDPQTRREQERAAEVETAAPTGRFAVQVGAFETSRAAENLANSLRDKGFPVYVSPGVTPGKARWRVRVGPLVTREEAASTAARLKKLEKLPTWILSEDAT